MRWKLYQSFPVTHFIFDHKNISRCHTGLTWRKSQDVDTDRYYWSNHINDWVVYLVSVWWRDFTKPRNPTRFFPTFVKWEVCRRSLWTPQENKKNLKTNKNSSKKKNSCFRDSEWEAGFSCVCIVCVCQLVYVCLCEFLCTWAVFNASGAGHKAVGLFCDPVG